MSIRWFFLAILLCALVSAHRLPGEQDTRATFLVSEDSHQGALWIQLPSGTNNLTFLLQYTDTDQPVQKLDTVHEKIMHITLMGEDLTSFYHVHPQDNGTIDSKHGRYTLPITLEKAGRYLVAVDFSTGGIQQFHTLEINVIGQEMMGEPSLELTDQSLGEYRAVLLHDNLFPSEEQKFTIGISKEGKPITDIEPYLGADLHVAIFSADMSHAGHTHPTVPGHFGVMANMPQRFSGPNIPFSYSFPRAGKYVLFTQFKHEGKVRIARFVVDVQDPLKLPYIWFIAGALVIISLVFMYAVRKNIHKNTQ